MKTASLLFFAALAAGAQTPNVSNAQFETRAVTGDAAGFLGKLVSSEAGPVWAGYAVEAQEKENSSCCWDDHASGCRLEGGAYRGDKAANQKPVQLEGSRNLFVLFRIQNHAIGKFHPVSGSCPLDAGGLRFLWLTGVTAPASVAFVSGQIGQAGGKGEADSALATIAMHAGSAADEALERFTAASEPEWLREKALFWLANSRGARGFAAVKNAALHDTSVAIREKTMFDFTLSKEPQAIDALIYFAKQDPAPRVRSQALFWLAQKAGQRASETITDAIRNDPDTEVKKKAVFGLQQLPPDQGVPLLIQVARTSKNPEVRKQAVFWLGQSGDPRALAFFQEILLGKS
jgi:HEAT repeat protein